MARKKTSKSKSSSKSLGAKSTPISASRKVESIANQTQRSIQDYIRSASSLNYDQALSTAKEQFEKIGVQFYGGYEDVTQISKDNVDALVRSSQILAKSAEQISRAIAGFAQSSLEMSAQAGQAVLGVKTISDLIELQSEYARNSMDHFIAGTSKITDISVKVANEAIEPINQRVNEAVEKISKQIAA